MLLNAKAAYDEAIPADHCKELPLISANVLHHRLHSTLWRKHVCECVLGREVDNLDRWVRRGDEGREEREEERETLGINFNALSSFYWHFI